MKNSVPRMIVCPLNWGMGHASRLIPVIDHYHKKGFEIILAGSGNSGTLLKTTYPDFPFYTLPSFEISYSRKGFLLGFSVIKHLPSFILSAIKEHRTLNRLISELKIDVVISDNRYGLFNKKAYCIFITHQISPILPAFFRWAEFPIYLFFKTIIGNYNECWIPDFKHPEINLTGHLSHRFRLPSNAKFIGILSRFCVPENESVKRHLYDIVIVISGPPPHSEILTDLILKQSLASTKKILIISGFLSIPVLNTHSNVTIVKHLGIHAFRDALVCAKIVVCRAGYSGIMDLIALRRTAYIIPTPGQTEQQYLGKYLGQKSLFRLIDQNQLELNQLSVIPDDDKTEWLNQILSMQKELPEITLK